MGMVGTTKELILISDKEKVVGGGSLNYKTRTLLVLLVLTESDIK